MTLFLVNFLGERYMPLKIKSEAFATKVDNPADADKSSIRKYNIRLHKTDLVVLDALAARNGISRSQLLNQIVERILLNSLSALDVRAAAYVAQTANQLAGIQKEEGWLLDLANQMYSAVHELNEKCSYDDAFQEELTDRDQIHEKLSQAVKDGKLGKV